MWVYVDLCLFSRIKKHAAKWFTAYVFCWHVGATCRFGVAFWRPLESKGYQKWVKGRPHCITKLIWATCQFRDSEKQVRRVFMFRHVGATWSILFLFWHPLDFEGVPTFIVFEQNQHKLPKSGDQERCQKKDAIMMGSWCEQEMPWLQFKGFRWIRKFDWNVRQKVIHNHPKTMPWAISVRFFEMLLDLRKIILSIFFARQKNGPTSPPNKLWGNLMFSQTLVLTPFRIQRGPYTCRFWQTRSTFSYLTTPDTGRCR